MYIWRKTAALKIMSSMQVVIFKNISKVTEAELLLQQG